MSFVILISAAVFSVAFAPVDQTAIQGNVMVRGRVMTQYNGPAIKGATVIATSTSAVQTTTTDAQGNFFFLTLLPGDYKFAATAPGYMEHCAIRPPDKAYELDAGVEYMATIWLFPACY